MALMRAPVRPCTARVSDGFGIGAALDRNREHDGAIARVRVGSAVGFVIT